MPVCPVARKSTATSALGELARQCAARVYFLPSAQSVPTVSRRLPDRLRPVAIGMLRGGVRTSISLRPRRSAACFNCGDVIELGVHAADDVETRLERLDQRRHPALADDAAGIGDADDQRARTARARFLGRQAAADPW